MIENSIFLLWPALFTTSAVLLMSSGRISFLTIHSNPMLNSSTDSPTPTKKLSNYNDILHLDLCCILLVCESSESEQILLGIPLTYFTPILDWSYLRTWTSFRKFYFKYDFLEANPLQI
jgi:hypothetical protein